MAASARHVLMGLMGMLWLGLACSNRILRESVAGSGQASVVGNGYGAAYGSGTEVWVGSGWGGGVGVGIGMGGDAGVGTGIGTGTGGVGVGTGIGTGSGIGIGIGTGGGRGSGAGCDTPHCEPACDSAECRNQGIIYQEPIPVPSGCQVVRCNPVQINGASSTQETAQP